MRSLSSNALAKIVKTKGTEPLNQVEIQWTAGGQIYKYGDKLQGVLNGQIVSLGNIDSVINSNGSSSDSQSVSVTLNDTTGKNGAKNAGRFVDEVTGTVSLDAVQDGPTNPESLAYDASTKVLSFDPKDDFFTKGKIDICGKKSWATISSIEWEGVSNYNQCEM